jgi:hypothetical protein
MRRPPPAGARNGPKRSGNSPAATSVPHAVATAAGTSACAASAPVVVVVVTGGPGEAGTAGAAFPAAQAVTLQPVLGNQRARKVARPNGEVPQGQH